MCGGWTGDKIKLDHALSPNMISFPNINLLGLYNPTRIPWLAFFGPGYSASRKQSQGSRVSSASAKPFGRQLLQGLFWITVPLQAAQRLPKPLKQGIYFGSLIWFKVDSLNNGVLEALGACSTILYFWSNDDSGRPVQFQFPEVFGLALGPADNRSPKKHVSKKKDRDIPYKPLIKKPNKVGISP